MEAEIPFQRVEAFHEIFDPGRPEISTVLIENKAHTRAALKIEGLVGSVAATSPNKKQLREAVMPLHEILDKVEEKIFGEAQWGSDPLVEQVDALADILYSTYGFSSLLGVVLSRISETVHQASVGKLFSGGKLYYNPAINRVLKPGNQQTEYAPKPKIVTEI